MRSQRSAPTPHGGYTELVEAIAEYAGVRPGNIVLGNGSDDLILLCARAYAKSGDTVAIANEPTYPVYRSAAGLAGATVADESPVLTFQCRPNNPSGALDPLDPRRPLVVDEAYYEYAGDTVIDQIENDVIVLRTFSKAFGLAGARVGYAIASTETAAELRRRQDPLPLAAPSVALALAALADRPGRRSGAGRARALRQRAPRVGSRARPVVHELRLRPIRRRRGPRGDTARGRRGGPSGGWRIPLQRS